jgi:3-(3-hydroxy-phenyl)propionate hydroxylase
MRQSIPPAIRFGTHPTVVGWSLNMQPAQNPQPICIVGSGPVGLYAALLLVNAGVRVTVLEQNKGLSADMRAFTFHPATLDLLEGQGLDESLAALGSITEGWQYMIHGTKEHAVFDLSVIADLTRHPYRLQCEQYHFAHLALERLLDSPLFEIRFGDRLEALEDDGAGLSLRVSGSSGERRMQTPWLIAADGSRSSVRRLLQLPFEGSDFPQASLSLVVDHPFQDDVPGLLGVNYVWTRTGYYSLMQLRDLWRFSCNPDPDLSAREALSEPAAQAHLQAVFPRPRPYTIVQRNFYRLRQRCLATFRHGRVLFAGDAAHQASPIGGMGMNSGMHDAHCLVEHLLPVLDGADEGLLDRYSRRRRTIALEEVQRLAARNHRWHVATDPAERRSIWQALQEVLADPEQTRNFLAETSMIRSRQREQEID